MSNSDLTGTIALVTGATSGIGKATAHSLSGRGAHVLVDPLRVYSNPGAPADATRQELSSLTRPTEDERQSR